MRFKPHIIYKHLKVYFLDDDPKKYVISCTHCRRQYSFFTKRSQLARRILGNVSPDVRICAHTGVKDCEKLQFLLELNKI